MLVQYVCRGTSKRADEDDQHLSNAQLTPKPKDEAISSYEAQRRANIQENEDILRKLGIIKPMGMPTTKANKDPKRMKAKKVCDDTMPARASTRLKDVVRPNYVEDTHLFDVL